MIQNLQTIGLSGARTCAITRWWRATPAQLNLALGCGTVLKLNYASPG